MKMRTCRVIPALLAAILSVCGVRAIASVTIVEDFATDPTARGWVDSSATNFGYDSTNHCLSGTNVKRNLNEAYYISLPQAQTTSDDFNVQYDMYVNNDDVTGGWTNQQFLVGFLNKTTWFDVAGHENQWYYSNTTIMTSWNYDNSTSNPATQFKACASTYTSASTYQMVSFESWQTFVLSYTSSTRTISLSMYALGNAEGTPLWTTSKVLKDGELLDVDAFGIFTGRTSIDTANGLDVQLDNVRITAVPEPVTLGALIMGGIAIVMRKRANIIR